MSSTVAPNLQDRIQTISDAFAAFDESRAAGGSDPTFVLDQRDIEDQLERMCTYRVPMDEPIRTVVRKACTDADLDWNDLTDDLAKLAGYGGRPQKATRTMLNSIDEADKWVDVVAEVVELWMPGSEKIAQVGLLGDESSRLKFVAWASADLPELEEGGTYEFESVVTDEYQGQFSVSCNSVTSISETDQSVEVSDGTLEVVGSIVDVQEGSGLIRRW